MKDKDLDFPRKEMYYRFLDIFGSRVANEHPGVCFFTYGSINDPKEFYPGVADIDAGLILDSRVVSNKHRKEIRKLSEVLAEALIETGVKIDLNLLDRQTNKDGRFLSYTRSMTDHIKADGKIISGPSYFVDGLNGLNYRHEDLTHCSMMLRSLRNRLLFSVYDSETDYKRFAEGVLANVKKAVKFPKQLVLVKTGKLINKKAGAREELEKLIDRVDLEGVVELNGVLRNLGGLTGKLKDKNNAMGLLEQSLDAVELMIRDYLNSFPVVSERECRDSNVYHLD